MIYAVWLAAVWWEWKSAEHWELLHQGGRWSKIERGDIVNKGDIVCNADDSQAAEEPLSVCDTSSIIPSPVLSLSDLLHSPFTHFLFLNGWVRLLSFFFLLRSWRIALVISPRPFLSLIFSLSGCFSSPILPLFFNKVPKSQTLGCHIIFSVSKCQSIYTCEEYTHFLRRS